MIKLVRSLITGMFLTSDGGWTTDPAKAWEMQSAIEAQKALRQFNLEDVELYFSFGEDAVSKSFNFSMPLQSFCEG